jgi:putative ABC transport system ATP-binding protein
MLLDVVDLRKSYRDTQGCLVEALRGVTLGVARGEFVAVAGPSGCGKTTLLNLLGCLDRPDSGHYRFAGEDVAAWSERRRADLRNQRIGFIFQSYHLLPFLTVAENVRLPFLYSEQRPNVQRIAEVLHQVGLDGHEGRYPGELSGGQQQRVAVARALVLGADLLLADEPTGNLDTATAQALLDVFAQLVGQGKTVVLVTHDAALAARATRQVRMEAGLIASDAITVKGGPA